MKARKKDELVIKLKNNFRKTSRELVTFETEEETLQFLADCFRTELYSDFVGIIMKDGEYLTLKVWSGTSDSIVRAFPIRQDLCAPSLIKNGMTNKDAKDAELSNCEFTQLLANEKVPTWFTVPLQNELNLIGFCVVGFFRKIELIDEMENVFEEFGKDVAIAILYQKEKNHKQKLHFLLNYQQTLVKETVEGNGFDGITKTLSRLFSKSVILLDRFIRPISFSLFELEEDDLDNLVELVTYEIFEKQQRELWFSFDLSTIKMAVWPIHDGGNLLGYLAVDVTNEQIDDYYRLSIDLARNIYSIQFIKQKLVFDAKEQVKDSFINKLLVEKLDDEVSIIQYANIFNWDIFKPHHVAILTLTGHAGEKNTNLLEQEAEKAMLWEQLKSHISMYYPELLIANKEGEWILIAPVDENLKKPIVYWSNLYEKIKKWLKLDNRSNNVYLAVGGKTNELSDYYICYLQALKTLNVVIHRFKDIGFALFDDLGAYTLLDQLKDSQMTELFINKHLKPLFQYSEGKNINLIHTLRVFLEQNGSIKETAEELFIHRSTLLYRLEKIQTILDVDLNYSEHRFNLMIAFKLYDLS